jgi:putative hydrolase of the HAD superfamily
MSEFPYIHKQCITEVEGYLNKKGLLKISSEMIWNKVKKRDSESRDYRVRHLEERLVRIFQVDSSDDELLLTMCRYFMKPIFARGRRYEDTIPVLQELKSRGFKMGIISNLPCGSPSILWREELKRQGLDEFADAVFCSDVGWRKPAKQIFEFALKKWNVNPEDCVFIGDDPIWDIVGPRAVGIEAILIDREGTIQDKEEELQIKNLYELLSKF